MSAVETIKRSSLTNLVTALEKVRTEPTEVKTWGVTAGSALIGAAAMAVSTQGLLTVVTFLSTPAVALTVGALGGGLLGWRCMREGWAAKPSYTDTGTTTMLRPGIDDLELINGITPVYADRLRAAGVHTFAQLAALLPERVHLIIGLTAQGEIIQSERWIADARQLAQRRNG